MKFEYYVIVVQLLVFSAKNDSGTQILLGTYNILKQCDEQPVELK